MYRYVYDLSTSKFYVPSRLKLFSNVLFVYRILQIFARTIQ